jgi:hypothetical protein
MPVSASLRGRVPGQVAIRDIVAAQREVGPRSLAARFFALSPLTPTTRGLYRAALGEVVVGEMLDQLGPQWDVLHVVPVDDDDIDFDTDSGAGADADSGADVIETTTRQIDHLLIGPPGVFALTTENYPGQEVKVDGEDMTIGGRPVGDIAVARRLAAIAADRLGSAVGHGVRVEPVIVVVGSTKLAVREQPMGVTIVDSKHLVRLLTRVSRSLAGADVANISDVADRDSTWEAAPTRPEESLALNREFAALREQVHDATQARVIWGVLAFAVISTSAWIGTVMIVENLLGH